MSILLTIGFTAFLAVTSAIVWAACWIASRPVRMTGSFDELRNQRLSTPPIDSVLIRQHEQNWSQPKDWKA